jgi:hypothetical protein
MLRFRRDQISSGVSRLGHLRPGGRLSVEYDVTRLLPDDVGTATADFICHVRFTPRGEERSGSLQLRRLGLRSTAAVAAGAGLFETTIPPETTSVEIWFERRDETGTTGWDSRYGQNYRFAVTPSGLPVPEQSVVMRQEAKVDPATIRVVDDTATKQQAGARGATLQTAVSIHAQIQQASSRLSAWADVHVFDAFDELVHTATITLEGPEEVPTPGQERAWHADVYQGSGGGSGAGVWSRPDAHTVQYRLYCQLKGTLYTDGILHQFDVPSDTEVRPVSTL